MLCEKCNCRSIFNMIAQVVWIRLFLVVAHSRLDVINWAPRPTESAEERLGFHWLLDTHLTCMINIALTAEFDVSAGGAR